MIDTSVWIECQDDANLRKTIERLAKKYNILACPAIDEETEKAIAFLKDHNMGWEELKSLYQSLRKDVDDSIRKREKQIEDEYLQEGVKLGLPLRGMKADLSIVAFASVQDADVIISLNRKSMASDYAKFVYMIVNSRQGLKVPQFITEKSMVIKLSET